MRILVILSILCLLPCPQAAGQETGEREARTFSIDRLAFDSSEKAFAFEGRTDLPDRTRMVVSILLNGHEGASTQIGVEDGSFRGEFAVGDLELLPGRYELRILVARDRQRPDVFDLFPEGFEDDRGNRFLEYRPANITKTWHALRKDFIAVLRDLRQLYDRTYQTGGKILDEIEATLADRERPELTRAEGDRMVARWTPFFEKTEGLLEQGSQFKAKYVSGTFICPYQDAARSIVALHEALARLRAVYTIQILTAVGRQAEVEAGLSDLGGFTVHQVASQIHALAWSASRELDAFPWDPQIEIGKERGTLEERTYTSRTSRFRIDLPEGEGWEIDYGEADSPTRLAAVLNLGQIPMASVQVAMVEFPWATTREERAEAWVRLAENNWPRYQEREMRFVREEAEDGAVREYCLFRFSTRSQWAQSTIECHLYFPDSGGREHTVYGVMIVPFYQGVVRQEEDLESQIEAMAASFEVLD